MKLQFSLTLTFLMSSLIALPATTQAQLVDCDGVWTNRGCKKPLTSPPLEETTSKPLLPEERVARKKGSLIHDLQMRALQVRRDYGVILDLTPTEDYCKEPNTTLDECQQRIFTIDERLSKRALEVQTARTAEQTRKVEEERLRLEQKRLELEAQRAIIETHQETIIIDRDAIRPRPPHHRTGTPSPSPTPIPTPTQPPSPQTKPRPTPPLRLDIRLPSPNTIRPTTPRPEQAPREERDRDGTDSSQPNTRPLR